ncbi:YbjN domain-containing protein [Agitococcus lubricus]|uniref:Putative sensory transduction regulator n=1 Tax=Agitococcus lubricus TaxID=1077255 RepID=A0A2T5IU22_9GAMM|nr:YbjN domain-containing protein [Agitococcus lubricus]PTQ87381.1 putative sensory transduction regulator [Agitococcus lubricus]
MSDILQVVSPQQMVDMLQKVGCRAVIKQEAQQVQVHSAAQGLNFAISFGQAQGEGFTDIAFSCAIKIEGDPPAQLIDGWNQQKRFTRLLKQGEWLVLVMDVLVAGGVTPVWLSSQCELWDGLLKEYVRYLQNPSASS